MEDETTLDAEVVDAGTALMRRDDLALRPVMTVQEALGRLEEFQSFCQSYLHESKDGGEDGGDYGIIPGTKRKTLLKAGADKLAEVYGLADTYVITAKVEDWERGLFDYTIECRLLSKRTGKLVGTGMGSCSSFESRYRWREAKRVCPACGTEAIIKGREEYGGGWLCFKKLGGCGEKFADGDPVIEKQTVGRVENPDIIDAKNTVLKIAKKRAKVDGVIGVTRSSGIFTQDMDDLTTGAVVGTTGPASGTSAAPKAAQEKPKAQATAAQEKPAQVTAAGPPEEDGDPGPAGIGAAAQAQAQAQARPVAVVPPKAQAQAKPAAEKPAAASAEAGVQTTVDALDVKSGTTNGKPWSLYIVRFAKPVRTSDGKTVKDASTLEEDVAMAAENARASGKVIIPVIVPSTRRKGSYELKGLDYPAE